MAFHPSDHARVPQSAIESLGGDGDLIVTFDFQPGTSGSADAFSIEEVSFDLGGFAMLTPEEEEQVATWLAQNWQRPPEPAQQDERVAETTS